jgi:putative phosphoesterase
MRSLRKSRLTRAATLGVISDTHGLLRPEAKAALAGCDAIVHAGDIGKPEVLDELATIAPVTAVRGNVDRWAARRLPATAVLELAGRDFYVLHDVNELDLDPAAAGFAAVVAGHSHVPSVARKDGVLYLNPGSAGPRRFKLPIALARVRVTVDALEPEILYLPFGE